MSLGQPHRTISWDGLRGRKALVLFVVLVLSGGAFILAAGEARAQQQDPAPKVYAAVTGPERTPVTAVGDAGPKIEAQPVDSSPLRTGERDADPSPRSEPDPVMLREPEPVLALLEEVDLLSGLDLLPDPSTLESFGAVVEPGPAPVPLDPVPLVDPSPAFSPVGFGLALADPGLVPAYGPVPSRENEPLSPAGSQEGVRTALLPGNVPANAVPVAPSPPVAGQNTPVPAVPKPPIPGPAVPDPPREASLLVSGLESAASSAVETLQDAASAAMGVSEALATGGEASTGPLSDGAEGSSPDTPPPPPPSPAPPGGSSFSLSGAGHVGPGGVAPLLVCILAAGLILLRPVGRLSWAPCESLPKPSSALLLPLERPG